MSEKIDKFLDTHSDDDSPEREEAIEFLDLIRTTIVDTKWVIDRENASFKAKNRTKDKLLSLSVACDIYADDKVFYSTSFTRSNMCFPCLLYAALTRAQKGAYITSCDRALEFINNR